MPSVLVLLLLLNMPITSARLHVRSSAYCEDQIRSDRRTDDQRDRKYACLPPDVRLTDVVGYDLAAKKNLTLENTLISIGAKCRNHKLVDKKRREIRFFRPACWGHPPPNYLEIEQKEDEELKKLK
jgi:hypothetical protein